MAMQNAAGYDNFVNLQISFQGCKYNYNKLFYYESKLFPVHDSKQYSTLF